VCVLKYTGISIGALQPAYSDTIVDMRTRQRPRRRFSLFVHTVDGYVAEEQRLAGLVDFDVNQFADRTEEELAQVLAL